MKLNNVLIICFLVFSLTIYGQSANDRLTLGKQHAEKELESTLNDINRHNVVKSETIIIKDSLTAIAVAEPILFGIYGESNITKQRPYEIYHIDNYWVISGTLAKGRKGGTFLIIINDRNSQVIKITHGK